MKNIRNLWILALPMNFFTSIVAMDKPAEQSKNQIIYVATSDGIMSNVERWKIDAMKTLLVLFEHQRNKNGPDNPLQATMVNTQELKLVCDALDTIAQGTFEDYYNQLEQKDVEFLTPGTTIISLEKGLVRTLINAAGRLEASGVSAFCLSYIMPIDAQKNALVPYLIEPVITMIPLERFLLQEHSKEKSKKYFKTIEAVSLSPDGNKIISENNNDLTLWDITNSAEVKWQFLKGHPKKILAVAFSSDGRKIISSCHGNKNNLILWDISNLDAITYHVLSGNSNSINAVGFSPDGSKIVLGDALGNLFLWDIRNLNDITSETLVTHPRRPISAVGFSPDASTIVSCGLGDQENLILWDIRDPNKITHTLLAGHTDSVLAVEFSPDSSKMISGGLVGEDKENLFLWDIRDSNKITGTLLTGHPQAVVAVRFSSDGNKIISGGEGDKNNLILWNISNQHAITHTSLEGCQDFIKAVGFGSGGSSIVVSVTKTQNDLILYLLPSKIKKELFNCTLPQAKLLYQFYLAKEKGFSMQLRLPYFMQIIDSLPQSIKDLLAKHFDISK
jgi:WD40 repeat protein